MRGGSQTKNQSHYFPDAAISLKRFGVLTNATTGKSASTQKQIAPVFVIAEGLAMTGFGEDVQYHPPQRRTLFTALQKTSKQKALNRKGNFVLWRLIKEMYNNV